jgi:hypothetical protein
MSRRFSLRDSAFHEIRTQGMSLLLRTSSSRNVEMSTLDRFQDFTFHKIRAQGVSLHLGVSGHRKDKMPKVETPKRLVPIDFWILCFTKSGYKEYHYSLGSPITENTKCRNAWCLLIFGFRISRNQDTRSITTPWGLRSLKIRNAKIQNTEMSWRLINGS